jgi:hypothetical protein
LQQLPFRAEAPQSSAKSRFWCAILSGILQGKQSAIFDPKLLQFWQAKNIASGESPVLRCCCLDFEHD